jgi:O-antigen ligase
VGGLGSIVTAWWLSGDERRIGRALVLAAGGLLVGILANFPWADFQIYLHGARLTKLSLGANGPGLYTMSAIIGLVLLGFPRILRVRERHRRYALFALAAVVLSVLGVVFVWNQARSAWVAAAVVLPVLTVVLTRDRSSRRVGVAMGAALALLALVVLANGQIVAQRLGQEHHVMKLLAEGDIADVPDATAIGERVYIWKEGARRIAMRPLFGWGPGTARMLSSQPGALTASPFTHYHDIFMQIWAEFGLMGLILFVSVWGLMAGKLVGACRRGWASRPYAYFAGGVLAFSAIDNLVEIRHDDGHGMFYFVFLGGLLLAYWVHGMRRSPPATGTAAQEDKSEQSAAACRQASARGPGPGATPRMQRELRGDR